MKKTQSTRNFGEVIRHQLQQDPELQNEVQQASLHARIAQEVYELRNEAGLTQKQLAERVGTQQSVISRIEDADYEGHSLAMLVKIASALGKEVNVRFLEPPTEINPSSPRKARRRK